MMPAPSRAPAPVRQHSGRAPAPALSFKIKLLAAMMVVVVGVTFATLAIAQNRFQANYQQLFTELFKSKNEAFLEKQALILQSIKQASLTLVGSPRLQLALSAALEGGKADDLYLRAKGELETRQILAAAEQSPNPMQAEFYLFLDRDGQVIPPPSMAGLRPLNSQDRFKDQLARIGQVVIPKEQPVVSYVTPQHDDGEARLHPAVFTKIIDTPTGEPLGALALGSPMPDLGESKHDQYKFKGGILLENRLYSRTITGAEGERVAALMAEKTKATGRAPEDVVISVFGEPHRLFSRTLSSDPGLPRASLVALFSIKASIDAQNELRARIIFIGVLGLVAALLLSLLLSHGLTTPIAECVAGTVQIQRGNFEVRVPVRSRDEIGRLAESFNEMAVGLALKEKYRSVLDKVTDKEVAEELMKGTMQLGGETREISVLFCDIRGFTALTQGMNPTEVIRMLNEHFTPLTRVVTQHKGVVDKFVGDLIMAVFGAPKSYGHDSLNATRCALDMIRERETLNATSRYQIQVGIGVATGQAVAGNMGSSDRLNYTVLGERVNLASRLCSKAGRMEVVIDQTTLDRLGSEVQAQALPELELKGFTGRVPAYKLLGVSAMLKTA